jgi:hypothetical protein
MVLLFVSLMLLSQSLVLLLEERDAEELVLVVQGYYLLLTDRTLPLLHVRTGNEEIGRKVYLLPG